MSFDPIGLFGTTGQSVASMARAADTALLDAAYPKRERPTSGTMYSIINIGRKRYFNLGNGDTREGAPVIGWPIDNRRPATNEHWKLVLKGDKVTLQCLLTLQQHGQVGGFAHVASKTSGTKATHRTASFEWILEETRDRVYLIKPVGAEGLCLTAASERAGKWQEAQLVLANKLAAPLRENQEWVFIRCT